MKDLSHLGHGARKRPEHLKVKDHVATAVPPFDWSRIREDPIGNVSGLFGISDQDQNGSGSCTCQTTRYGFKYAIGLDVSSEDLYSHVVLPGGGAYLNAPLDFARNRGVLSQAKFPDPDPQSEASMTRIIQVPDGDRIRTFELKYTFYPDVANIDSAAHAATEHDYIHLGIDGSWAHGWADPVDPKWEGVADWAHAVFACKESIVLRHGVPAIKARSSWCKSKIYCHYLNKDYFKGCFEIIGVDLKELFVNQTKLVLGKDGKTVYKAIPVATTFDDLVKQCAVEGITVPDPIPPATIL